VTFKITPFFRWYDLWVGAYVDTKGKALYLCPVPMLGVKVERDVPPPKVARCVYCRCELTDAEFFTNGSVDFGDCCDDCIDQRREEERELREDISGHEDEAPF
jgi:hypothetical protein